jgi:hypothetical protein
MQVAYMPPSEKGVTTLMYIGDDGLDKATSDSRGAIKTLAIIAALYVGYRIMSGTCSFCR